MIELSNLKFKSGVVSVNRGPKEPSVMIMGSDGDAEAIVTREEMEAFITGLSVAMNASEKEFQGN